MLGHGARFYSNYEQYVRKTYCFLVILLRWLGAEGCRKIEKHIYEFLTVETMEKNEKEPKTSKYRSYFVMKVLLFVFCVAIVVLLVVVAKCFASLKDLNSRVNTLEKETRILV